MSVTEVPLPAPDAAPEAAAEARPRLRLRLPAVAGVWLAVLALVIAGQIASPGYLEPNNLFNVVRQASVVGVVAVGVTFVMVTGGVDLSVGAIVSLGAVMAAMIMDGNDANTPTAIALTLLMGVGVGLFNGILVAYARIPSFILTLGTATILAGITQITTGGTAAGVVAPDYRTVLNERIGDVPVLALVFLGVAAIGVLVERRTRFARHLFLTGANPAAARVAGVPTERTVVLAFVLSGLAGALGGLVLLARSGVSSNFAGTGYEFEALVAVILGGAAFTGGRGSVIGTVGGALVLAFAFSLVNVLGLDFDLQLVVRGSVLVLAATLHGVTTRRRGGDP